MQFAASSASYPAEIETLACPAPDMPDVLSAIARIEKHAAQFACEVDTVDATEWDRLADEFDGLDDDQSARYSRGQRGADVSHLLLQRHGKTIAGARVVISKLPGFRRGHAVLRFGPFWHRRGESADLTIYRATLGAIVQEYCIGRGHRLTIIPHPDAECHAGETKALVDFGFDMKLTGEYAFRLRLPARIIGEALYILRGVRRSIQRWCTGA